MRLFLILAVMLALIAGAVLLLPGRASAPAQSKPAVVATIFPLADWLREIGGGEIEVHCLVGGAADPHHFEPTVNDALKVTHARAIFAVGLELDPWIERLASNSATSKPLFETGEWIDELPVTEKGAAEIQGKRDHAKHKHHDHDDPHHHHHGGGDPHFWLDPQRAITVVARMSDELSKIVPGKKGVFEANAARYTAKLRELDQKIVDGKKDTRRLNSLVTFHDAYNYLFDRIGIKTAAVVRAVPGVEPSVADCAEAIKTMKQIQQRTVFVEPASSMQAAAKVLARELNASVELLDPLDTEYSDAGKTYLERMNHNIETLNKALK